MLLLCVKVREITYLKLTKISLQEVYISKNLKTSGYWKSSSIQAVPVYEIKSISLPGLYYIFSAIYQ